ncbi:MAG: glycosylase/AP lyase Nei 1 [Planctomycetota bacterium]|jgi:endonuclease-8
MPEGHTIHRIAADHRRDFVGQRLAVLSPQGRFSAGAGALDGRVLTGVEAHGKHLLYDWDGRSLHIHLGLYGKFRRHKAPPPEPRGAVRLRVVGEQFAFDLNGPAACELLTPPQVQALLDRLGADPLREDADPEQVWVRIRRSPAAIGAVLMNQEVIAGVGNVYRSEILHLLHIHPSRKANTLQRSEFDALWRLTVELLRIGKRYNRIIIADPQTVGKARGRMTRDERLLVYRKDACSRCAAPIETWTLAARKIYACPMCQLR